AVSSVARRILLGAKEKGRSKALRNNDPLCRSFASQSLPLSYGADYPLELEQLKGGVNRDVKEVRFATRADFAYIETNSFYVSQYFLGGCSHGDTKDARSTCVGEYQRSAVGAWIGYIGRKGHRYHRQRSGEFDDDVSRVSKVARGKISPRRCFIQDQTDAHAGCAETNYGGIH